MRNYIIIITVLFGFSSVSNAQRHDITGKVGQIRYHEVSGTLAPTWVGSFWFHITEIEGGETPSCIKFNGEYAIAVPQNNDTALAMILTAKNGQFESVSNP